MTFDVGIGIISAGDAALEVGGISEVQTSTQNPNLKIKATHFVATAKSNAFVDVFFKVRDKNESWYDEHKQISYRFEQHNQEGKYILDQTVSFDWEKKRVQNIENVKGRQPKIEETDLTVPVVDTLASLYITRTRKLNVGDEFSLDVFSGRTYPLVVKVLRRETVKVPAGKFDCFVVEPFLKERGIFIQKGKKLQVWLTADERKIPVMMKAEIFIGHVYAELKKIE